MDKAASRIRLPKCSTFGEQRSPYCIAKGQLMEGKSSPFAMKGTFFLYLRFADFSP